MEKITLDAHPSVIVAHCWEEEKFLFNVYDNGYPRAAYRGSANNIGGNPEAFDVSPQSVLINEISEEFDPNHPEEKKYVGKVEWASKEDILRIRNELLGTFNYFRDFLVGQQEVIEGGNKPYTAIYSAFYAPVSSIVIEIAERNIRDGKNIPTEGNIGVYTLEELAHHPRGEFSTAHVTAHILNWRFDCKIPHPKQITAEALGRPRGRFSDYLKDFEYNQENLRKAAAADFG